MIKKLIVPALIFSPFCSLANEFVLYAYDDTYYTIIEDLNTTIGHAGLLIGISDIYYTFKPLEKEVEMSQTEWLSDGYGSEVQADYDSNFVFHDMTLNNFYCGGENCEVFDWFSDLRSDFIQYVQNNATDLYSLSDYVLNDLTYITDKSLVRNIFRNYELNLNIPLIRQQIRQNTNLTNAVFYHDNNNINGTDIWIQDLYDYTAYSGDTSYTMNTIGLVFGADFNFNKYGTLGIGYNYNAAFGKVDIFTNNIFIYGKYNFDTLYANALIGLNLLKSDNVNSFGFMVATTFGYNMNISGLSSEIGVRYSNLELPAHKYLDDYNIGTTTVSTGIRYKYTCNNVPIQIETNAMLVFETNSFDTGVGSEAGLHINIPYKNIAINIGYDMSMQQYYLGHTGSLKLNVVF